MLSPVRTAQGPKAMLGPNYFQLVQGPEHLAVLLYWDKEAVSELVGPPLRACLWQSKAACVCVLTSGLEATYM